jgi:hypothetical protein
LAGGCLVPGLPRTCWTKRGGADAVLAALARFGRASPPGG